MELKEKINWLNRAYRAERLYIAYTEKMVRDREIARKLTRTFSESPSSTNSNSTENALVRFTESSVRAEEKLKELSKIRDEIEDAILQIEDYDLQSVLIMRYVNYFTYEKIAEKLHYGLRTVYRMHDRAVEKLAVVGID